MKKILLVLPLSTTVFGTRNAGGVDSVCQILVDNLVNNGSDEFYYRVCAFNPLNDGNSISTPVKLSDNIELVYFPSKEKRFGIPVPGLISCNLRVMEQVNNFRPDIIHSHLGVWLLGGFSVKRRIATLHSYKKICRNPNSFLNDLLYESVMPKIVDFFVTEYTVVGTLLKDALACDTNKDIRVIGNPISSAFFNTRRKIENSENLTFVTCALMTRRKRIELSIALLNRVRLLGIDARLLIIGPATDKIYYDELKNLVTELNLSNFVEFTGACDQQELINHYQLAQLGLFFSSEETFGLAPLEMMATGLPVVCTKVGVLSETILEFAKFSSVMTIDEFDIEDIASKIPSLINSEPDSAKNFIKNFYSVRSVNTKYESVYRRA